MPRERPTIRALGVAALIVAALGLGVFLGAPQVAVAQIETTTSVVEDDSTNTVVDEAEVESDETEGKTRGDHDCGDRSGDSTEDSSQSDA